MMTQANTISPLVAISAFNSSFTNTSGSRTPPASSGSSPNLGIAILSIAFIIGFPGNAFVIWTVLTRMKKRTVTCLLILHLAVADIMVILTAPFFLHLLSTGKWVFGFVICKSCHYVSCLSMYASIFLITFMSMDRFLAVAMPFTSQKIRTKRAVRATVSAIWILASLMAIPMLFYRDVIIFYGRPQCIPFHGPRNETSTSQHIIFQYLFETLTGFIIPFTIILFCYIYIGLRLRSAKFQSKQKTSRLVIMIIVTFALFWLPYQLVNLIQVSGEHLQSVTLKAAARTARPNATALAFLSSSANPILYVFAGGNFIRTAGVGFMAKLFEGTASETSSFRKISQVFRQRSHTESVELEKCNRAEQTKFSTNQSD
ncbi:leukotriene B4 receptor 1-like [Hyperolius riggenbachi]|uniref:leukotriene B4 receptor 1-like n=1 Tax=Hyperolius riggenbachi TaxID=752182 RepID=UPI0035A2923A